MDKGYFLVMAMVAIALITVFLAFLADANADQAKRDIAQPEPPPPIEIEDKRLGATQDHGDQENVKSVIDDAEVSTPESGGKETTAT